MQRGLAAIELVASIEAVEQTPEADQQPMDLSWNRLGPNRFRP